MPRGRWLCPRQPTLRRDTPRAAGPVRLQAVPLSGGSPVTIGNTIRTSHWDNAYDSGRLDGELAETGVEMIAPHRSNRRNRIQDGRPLRRYRRRTNAEPPPV